MKEKTLEFHNSDKDIIKASIWSLCLKIDEKAMPEWEEDLVVQYIMLQMGPKPTDFTRWENGLLFDNNMWTGEQHDPVMIRKFSVAQQLEHKYC